MASSTSPRPACSARSRKRPRRSAARSRAAAKKVGGAVATGAKRIGAGYKNVAVKIGKAIAKSPLGTAAKNAVKGVKTIVRAVKKFYGKK